MTGQRCGTCRHFTGQPFPKKPGWRHAAGRCGWPVPEQPVMADSVTRGVAGKALRDLDRLRSCVWPEDGTTCPVWETATPRSEP